jgi:hypothetical protein
MSRSIGPSCTAETVGLGLAQGKVEYAGRVCLGDCASGGVSWRDEDDPASRFRQGSDRFGPAREGRFQEAGFAWGHFQPLYRHCLD